jgi:acetyl-CoA carboxylase biotin carboxyl carrier protein
MIVGLGVNMPGPIRALSDDEVRQIKLIIETLDRSALDFLQLEFGDVKLMIGKGTPPITGTLPSASPSAPAAPMHTSMPEPRGTSATVVDRSGTAPAKSEAIPKDALSITAPMVGRFYARPEPGATPFVAVGSEVREDTTVAIIEVMKTFNSIQAGLRGVIEEICVEDAQFVEFGQVLFRVRPPEAC